jgi:hypothetical protein
MIAKPINLMLYIGQPQQCTQHSRMIALIHLTDGFNLRFSLPRRTGDALIMYTTHPQPSAQQ